MLSLFTAVEHKAHKKALDEHFSLENPNSYTRMTSFPPTHPMPLSQHSTSALFSYLAVQLPGSVVLLSTTSVENGLVVHFNQLPFRAVAEVAKHSTGFIMIK